MVVQSYDVKYRGGPNTHGPEKYGREAAYLGSDTVYNDWSQIRGDAEVLLFQLVDDPA